MCNISNASQSQILVLTNSIQLFFSNLDFSWTQSKNNNKSFRLREIMVNPSFDALESKFYSVMILFAFLNILGKKNKFVQRNHQIVK